MELRRHPKLMWQGRSSWPPTWGGGAGAKLPIGEVGVLRAVRRIPASSVLPAHLYLEIEYEGGQFGGALLLDDPDFLNSLYQKLSSCTGRPIVEIGALDPDE